MEGESWRGVTKWWVTGALCGEIAHKEAPLHSNCHNTWLHKFMAGRPLISYISQVCGDFQQGCCLYKPTSGIQWPPEHLWMCDWPQKQALAKADLPTFGSVVLVIT